jgi:hypothetical protein
MFHAGAGHLVEDAVEALVRDLTTSPGVLQREVKDGRCKPYSFSGMQKSVQRMRKAFGLPTQFTLDGLPARRDDEDGKSGAS